MKPDISTPYPRAVQDIRTCLMCEVIVTRKDQEHCASITLFKSRGPGATAADALRRRGTGSWATASTRLELALTTRLCLP